MAQQSQAVRDRFAYIDADAKVQQLDQALKEARKTAEDADRKARQALGELPHLLSAADLVFQQCWKFEDLSDEKDNELESLTCHDAECWSYRWSRAHDAMQELIYERCAAVTSLRNSAQELDAAANKLCDAWLDARKAAGAQFDADNPDRLGT